MDQAKHCAHSVEGRQIAASRAENAGAVAVEGEILSKAPL
jgi:hypothetical protein